MTLDQFKALPHPDWYETGRIWERLCGPLVVRVYQQGRWKWSVWGLGHGTAATEQEAKDAAWAVACREVHGSLADLGVWASPVLSDAPLPEGREGAEIVMQKAGGLAKPAVWYWDMERAGLRTQWVNSKLEMRPAGAEGYRWAWVTR